MSDEAGPATLATEDAAAESGHRFEPYPGYRDSGVEWLGEVPEHWSIPRLGFVVELNPSKGTVRDEADDMPVSFVPMDDIGEKGGLALTSERPLSEVVDGYTYFEDGDVLVAKITPCFENRKGALAQGLRSRIGFGTTELHVLRPRDQINRKFLFYLTISDHFRGLGEASMYGAAGQKRVPEEFVFGFRHPLPPLEEQRAIADFLDRETSRIDDLIAKKERLIELLDEKRTALITQAVTKGLDPEVPMKDSGVEWLGEIPEGWSARALYTEYDVQLGKMLDEKQITGENLAPYLRNVDVQWDEINTDDLPEMDFSPTDRVKYKLAPGDLLVCEGGEIGRTAIWNEQLPECYYQKALHRLRPVNKGSSCPRFMYYLMRAATSVGAFEAESNKNTIDHLTAVQLRHHRFPFPPAAEQYEISQYLDRHVGRLSQAVKTAQRTIEALREYRSALITAAVTGKIDVRKHAA